MVTNYFHSNGTRPTRPPLTAALFNYNDIVWNNLVANIFCGSLNDIFLNLLSLVICVRCYSYFVIFSVIHCINGIVKINKFSG